MCEPAIAHLELKCESVKVKISIKTAIALKERKNYHTFWAILTVVKGRTTADGIVGLNTNIKHVNIHLNSSFLSFRMKQVKF